MTHNNLKSDKKTFLYLLNQKEVDFLYVSIGIAMQITNYELNSLRI
ncbi:hypothetical protein [Zobellia sp. OII3]|nr:hypothetical protein [Zobellia sp. OII3]